MRNLCVITVLFLPLVVSQCPETEDIGPCKCTNTDGQRRLSCWGNIYLPRLTTVLRNKMCGRTVDKFELLGFNITYLPSNLFSKMVVDDIVIYSGHISRFTNGGRSAFSGLEDILKSLSMRRCKLLDDLQWKLLGEMHALSYLDLSYNELTRVPHEWASRPPPNLRSLLLKGNKITSLQPGALEFMYTLVELDLSENRISSFSRAFFPHSANSLIIIRLSYNRLQKLPRDLFEEMYGIRRIYLDNNNMSSLDETTWRPIWGDLEVLDLNDNELICDSNINWIQNLRPPMRLYGECSIRDREGERMKTWTLDKL